VRARWLLEDQAPRELELERALVPQHRDVACSVAGAESWRRQRCARGEQAILLNDRGCRPFAVVEEDRDALAMQARAAAPLSSTRLPLW